jgi:hypothetical protein
MSHEENELNPVEREVEGALGSLSPAPTGMTWGQLEVWVAVARERRRTRVWRAVAAVLAVAAGVALIARPSPRVVEVQRVVYRDARPIEKDRVTMPVMANGDFAYLRLRERVLARGVESLPVSRATAGTTRTTREMEMERSGRDQTPWLIDYLFSGGRS